MTGTGNVRRLRLRPAGVPARLPGRYWPGGRGCSRMCARAGRRDVWAAARATRPMDVWSSTTSPWSPSRMREAAGFCSRSEDRYGNALHHRNQPTRPEAVASGDRGSDLGGRDLRSVAPQRPSAYEKGRRAQKRRQLDCGPTANVAPSDPANGDQLLVQLCHRPLLRAGAKKGGSARD